MQISRLNNSLLIKFRFTLFERLEIISTYFLDIIFVEKKYENF